MTSPTPVPLGQYRGFAMDLSFESMFQQFKVTVKGALCYTITLGTDVFGNILRLDNLLESMEERINTCREQLEIPGCSSKTPNWRWISPFPRRTS